jgi:glycine betaine/proline transport system ATP-binding protein
MGAIIIQNLDVVFGKKPHQALPLLDEGKNRQEIIDETGLVVGVNRVSLTVQEGEICVLMGLSGSGKSSLLRAVNGLNDITRGVLEVKDGERKVDLAQCDKKTLRHLRTHRISMVFQKFALMPWLSVLDNVAFGLEMQGVSKAERREKARTQLEMVGLAKWESQYPHELSGGMQQRVGLARAFAMDTDILLMDEPFSALDPLIRTQLQDELITLQSKLNKTILFVSHDLDEALKIGNNIAIMESGQLIQHGKPEDIVLNPKNNYVRDFVAHTNPLNVLKGRSLMQPAETLTVEAGRWQVCDANQLWVEHDQDGLSLVGNDTLSLVHWHDKSTDFDAIDTASVVVAYPDIEMRDAIELKMRSCHPVLLAEAGKFIGVLNDQAFYSALLGDYQTYSVA